jgi:sortase A
VTSVTAPLPGVLARFPRRHIFNLLSVLLFASAVVMLGKASWIHVKAQVAQVLMDRAFDQAVSTGKPVKAWNWADTYPVARLEIARLGASSIVLDGTAGEALAFGPGLMHETARIGERGTAVISAHRDTHFEFLRDVKRGDLIAITRIDGLTFRYRVVNMRIADWDKSGISRQAPGFNLVLSTCWPFDAVTQGGKRYLVEAVME